MASMMPRAVLDMVTPGGMNGAIHPPLPNVYRRTPPDWCHLAARTGVLPPLR